MGANSFFLCILSVWTFKGLDVSNHTGEDSLQIPPTQMLIPSGNAVQAHPEAMFNPGTSQPSQTDT